jgi:nicotinamidase-related amidase
MPRGSHRLSNMNSTQGSHPLIDGYSAFAMNNYVQFTELPRILFSKGITKLTVVGLATDYCVRASVSA